MMRGKGIFLSDFSGGTSTYNGRMGFVRFVLIFLGLAVVGNFIYHIFNVGGKKH